MLSRLQALAEPGFLGFPYCGSRKTGTAAIRPHLLGLNHSSKCIRALQGPASMNLPPGRAASIDTVDTSASVGPTSPDGHGPVPAALACYI